MAISQTLVSLTQLEEQRYGYQAITLTNYTTTDLPAINESSIIEVGGSLYNSTSETAITGYVAATTAATAYIKVTVSGTTLVPTWTSTAPVWNPIYQYYASSASSATDRYIGGVYKTSNTVATNKWFYTNRNMKTGYNISGIGGYVIDANRDVQINVASDSYIGWDESPGEYEFYVSGTVECVIGTDYLYLPTAGSADVHIEVGSGRTGNGASYIDFISDPTYTDYGLRVVRNAGLNSNSAIQHRGTGDLSIITVDAAEIVFLTNNIGRFKIADATDIVGIGGYAGGVDRDCQINVASDSYIGWDESPGEYEFYVSGTVECVIGTNYFKMGGAAGGINRDFLAYFATDSYIGWDEAPGEYKFQISGTAECKIGTDYFKIGGAAGGVDRDSYIYFSATDYLFYDESDGYIEVQGAILYCANNLLLASPMLPAAAPGTLDIGSSISYFGEVNAKSFTDRSAIWVENPDMAYEILKKAKNEESTGFCANVELRGQKRLKYSDFPEYCWDAALEEAKEDIEYDDTFEIEVSSFKAQNKTLPNFKKGDKIIKKGEKTRLRIKKEIKKLENGTKEECKKVYIAAEGFDLSAGMSVVFGALQKCITKIEILEREIETLKGK